MNTTLHKRLSLALQHDAASAPHHTLPTILEAQLEEASRLRKMGAVLRAISVLASPPVMDHHGEVVNAETRDKTVLVTKSNFQDRPEKKSGPQPLRRRT